MLSKVICISNKLGLHARASAKLVALTGRFASNIHLSRNGKQVNGKSIMGVMMLAAAKGAELEVSVDGEDEIEALAAIEKLILDKFGEDK
jgi:phosphocarrier protein